MFELIHFLHIVSGVTWAGAAIAATLVWVPAMQMLPPEAIARYFKAARVRAQPIIAIAAAMTMLTGLARAVVGGGIQSVSDLWSPYGLYVIAALAIFLGIRAYGKIGEAEMGEAMAKGEDPRPAMRKSFAMDVLVYPGGVLALLGIMVVMRMGLY